MAKTEKMEFIIEGGKAAPTPALAQKLGPMKINIGAVMAKVNEKTKPFSGMQVPIKLEINVDTKDFEVSVGTPPVSAMIKKELKLEKGAKGEAAVKGKEIVGNLSIDKIIEITRGKGFNDVKNGAKQVVGTCKSMGVTVEGADPREIIRRIDSGEFDAKFK
ncbi:MAG: 50S ribosomal protein L11 [Candidatus Aenigmarchaeota archaeon]|nr:50S ribosomal protein L11 [Candidatus Aenigmarchaeota archaeon]